jgi:quercetin dioxygenase-like cupin family protein
VPIEVRRFGVGHRRPDGPPGTTGIEGQVIQSDARGVIAELAFRRRARITPHTNPSWSYFLVIEGGGWVGVGDERTRVQAGEAVVWPPDVIHAAWTDGTPMRAIVVEFAEPTQALGSGGDVVLEGLVRRLAPGDRGSDVDVDVDVDVVPRRVARGEGRLAPRRTDRARRGDDPEAKEGEPL